MSSTLQKTYRYPVYRNGVFLGNLPSVDTDFKFTHDINTAFVQGTIEVGISPDTSADPPAYLTTEAGEYLITESGEYMTTERAEDVFGSSHDKILARTDNDIYVIEYSADYPNGATIFKGYIQSVDANYEVGADKLILTVVSNGKELDNYVLQATGAASYTQSSDDDSYIAVDHSNAAANNEHWAMQTFAGSANSISAIKLKARALNLPDGTGLRIQINQMLGSFPSPGNDIGAGDRSNVVYDIGSTKQDVLFTFNTPVSLSVGSTYYIYAYAYYGSNWDANPQFRLYGAFGNPYANGVGSATEATVQTNGSYSGINTTFFSYDLYFIMYGTFQTTTPFTSQDPTAIFRSVMDSYNSLGGQISYSTATTDLTGLSVSYTFNTATTFEAIKKCLELAPYNWYWYVNPATDTIYFKQTPSTAAHTLIKGRHFNKATVRASIEQMINKVLFTGAVSGATNLFSTYTNQTSITANNNKIFLDRISDNRVSVQATADTMANNALNLHPNEEYTMVITILAGTYDTTLFNPGDIVAPRGFGNFLDNTLQQISRISREPDVTILTLGPLLKSPYASLADAQRQINALQTVANPSAPS